MNRGQLPARLLPTHPRGDGPERLSGRITICRNTPSHIMSPTRSKPGSSAEVSLGVRGHTPAPQRAHAPPPAGVPPASMPAGDTLTHTNHHPAEALDNQTTGQVSRSHTCAGQSAGLIDVGQRPFLPTAIVAFRPEAVLRRRTTPRCLWVESPQPGGRGATRRFLVLSQRTTPGRVRPSVWLQSARHERVLAHAPRSRLRLPPPCEARDRGR